MIKKEDNFVVLGRGRANRAPVTRATDLQQAAQRGVDEGVEDGGLDAFEQGAGQLHGVTSAGSRVAWGVV